MDLAPYARKGYSQFTESGIIEELVRRCEPMPFFVEIGAGNGEENCTRDLAEKGWDGLWIDADPCNIPSLRAIANRMPGRVDAVWMQITAANAMSALEGWPGHTRREFGVLSIDVDGNDYHIWKALGYYKPAIVVIEAQIQRPHDQPWIMDYDPYYLWPHADNDCGASVASLVELGQRMGYHFIGKCPDYHSPNLFLCRDDLTERVA